MIIYPAIDLRGGKVVRLREGDPERQTVFSDDPVAMARQWMAQGARWLHVVNLDGAFAAANDNSAILGEIARLGLPVQFGGGLRSL
ncbi:MAG: 1-(5-phosphoribosyl)-5-((5-phosphoribosylamino)methylideneamino)imidazole-4-carboxamide isomerase, partial [Anaerolineae bacterium]|nr:1-(5-phosphoribosyl)-5-((5-phosphoribosylamino)methylideneamino)imidazole-4-carboxamide isomerase [Anaerolineae bacterium]